MIYLIDIEKFFSGFLNMTKNPTLDAMKFFMDVYDHVDEKLKIIHVAGTNGKGACVEIMANILIANGYSVGKFMSPHLIKYNERININNEDISDLDLSDLITDIMPSALKYLISQFAIPATSRLLRGQSFGRL